MFDFDFTGASAFTLPAAISTGNPSKNPVTSPKVTNILLTKGLLGSLPLIGDHLNIANVIQATIDGQYFVPGLKYEQHNIETKYLIGAGGDEGIEINALGALNQILEALLGNASLATLQTVLGDLNNLPASLAGGLLTQIPGGVGSQLCGAATGLPILGGVLSGLGCPTSTSTTPAVAATPNVVPNVAPAAVTTVIAGVTNVIANGITTILGGASPTTPAVVANTPAAATPTSSTATATGVLGSIPSLLRRIEERLEAEIPEKDIRKFHEEQKRKYDLGRDL